MLTAATIDKEQIRELITRELVDIVKRGTARIEYNELSKVLKMKYDLEVNEHFGLKHYFDKISRKCFELGLPLISAVIVSKETQKPSSGFFGLYDELNGTHSKGNPVLEAKVLKQVKKDILSCTDWDKLTL